MTGPSASLRPGGWPCGGSVRRDDGIGGARASACGTVERRCDAKEEASGVGVEASGVGVAAGGVGEEAMTDEGGERNVTPRGAEAEAEAELESLQSSDKSARLSTAAVRTGAAGTGAEGRFLTRRMRERRR